MDLNKLNETLELTMNKLLSGEIKPEQVKSIVSVSNAINSNCKVILDVQERVKASGNMSLLGLVVSPEKLIELENEKKLYKEQQQIINLPEPKEPEKIYDKKLEFALKLGYNNIADAISDLGKTNFNNKFNNR